MREETSPNVSRAVYRQPNLTYVKRRQQKYFDGVSPIVSQVSKQPIKKANLVLQPKLVESGPAVTKPVTASVETESEKGQPVAEDLSRRWSWKKHRYQLAAALMVLVGGGVSLQSVFLNVKATEQVKAMSTHNESEQTNQLPSEDPPVKGDATKGYAVSPTLPRVISISKFRVKSRVLALGTNDKNEIDTPKNIYDVAWYTGSSKPGEQGAMLLSGHVSGPTKHGVFYDIKRFAVGDTIDVERGDGKHFSYVVKAKEQVAADKVDMLKLVNSIEPGKAGLNLITCGGSFDAVTGHFEDRTIAYAVIR